MWPSNIWRMLKDTSLCCFETKTHPDECRRRDVQSHPSHWYHAVPLLWESSDIWSEARDHYSLALVIKCTSASTDSIQHLHALQSKPSLLLKCFIFQVVCFRVSVGSMAHLLSVLELMGCRLKNGSYYRSASFRLRNVKHFSVLGWYHTVYLMPL